MRFRKLTSFVEVSMLISSTRAVKSTLTSSRPTKLRSQLGSPTWTATCFHVRIYLFLSIHNQRSVIRPILVLSKIFSSLFLRYTYSQSHSPTHKSITLPLYSTPHPTPSLTRTLRPRHGHPISTRLQIPANPNQRAPGSHQGKQCHCRLPLV